MDMFNKIDVYSLINSNSIREHCKKINHEFNIEEIAILLYRNNTISFVNKIFKYDALLEMTKDMPMTKSYQSRFVCACKISYTIRSYKIKVHVGATTFS